MRLNKQTGGDEVSSSTPDRSREYKTLCEWSPSRSLLLSIRSYQGYIGARNPVMVMMQKLAVLRHRFWSIVTGADIPLNCCIGGGLLMPHPNGIVIHPAAVIGPNCLIFQQVTIGSRGDGAPIIGGHVDIGAGAKVLGKISIGDNAIIGANAVVLIDVPAGATAVGVPATIVQPKTASLVA